MAAAGRYPLNLASLNPMTIPAIAATYPLRRVFLPCLAALGASLLLAGCGASSESQGLHHAMHGMGGGPQSEGDRRLFMSAAFGPDRRLWRVSVEGKQVLVDVSGDDGKTFGAPTAVNKMPQRIKARAEDRPQIAVDAGGTIHVVYSAEQPQPSSSYYSASTDGGKSFSEPVLASDAAAEANTHENNVLVTPDRRAFVFWHDERDRADWRDVGASIYYSTSDRAGALAKPNRKAAGDVCECCRTAVAADVDGSPVLFARIIYAGTIRDHGLIKLNTATNSWSSSRVSHDEWKIDVCPEQGPSLSIGPDGRYHVAWFSQGAKGSGLFYAYSADHGTRFSPPLPFGDGRALAGHPSVVSVGAKVAVAWQEFDGKEKRIQAMLSTDGGEHWSAAKTLGRTVSEADYPVLVGDGRRIFLQWTTRSDGFQMLKVE